MRIFILTILVTSTLWFVFAFPTIQGDHAKRLPGTIKIINELEDDLQIHTQEDQYTIYNWLCKALQKQWNIYYNYKTKRTPPYTSVFQQVKDVICYQSSQLRQDTPTRDVDYVSD